ncbi:hypothetical protein EPUL_000208, partial [Erysiphe pulchra]
MSNQNTRPTRQRVSNHMVLLSKVVPTESSGPTTSSSRLGKTFLDGWVEPVVPPPRPSYADAGIERHGVVQNMAPLGSRPSMKILKAATLLDGTESLSRPVRSRKTEVSKISIPARSIVTLEPVESLNQVSLSDPQEPHREKASIDEFIEERCSNSSVSEEQVSSSKSFSVSTPISQSLSHSALDLNQTTNFVDNITSDSEIFKREFSQSSIVPPATGKDGLPLINIALTDRVVELAVQNAVESKRWPTAYALRTLYDDNRGDIAFVRLLEAVYYNYATENDLDEFERLLKPKKFEGKKDRIGEYYFNSDGSNSITRRPIFSAIEAVNPPAPVYVTPYNSLPISSSSTNLSESSTTRSKSLNIDLPKARSSSTHTSYISSDPGHVSKKSRKNRDIGSNCVESIKTTTTGSTQITGGDMDSKSRSVSVSSSSSLSSVDESLIDDVSISPTQSIPNHGLATLGLFGAQPVFVSPYASANNFKEAASSADLEVRNRSKPNIAPQKFGPKIHTFAVPSSSNNIISNNFKESSEILFRRAETAPVSQPNVSSKKEKASNFSKKRDSKADNNIVPSYNINDEKSVQRLKAKEYTNNNTISKVTESFERLSSQSSMVPKEGDDGSKFEQTSTIAPILPAKRPQQIRLNHKLRQTKTQFSESHADDLGRRSEIVSNSSPPSLVSTPVRTNKRNRPQNGLCVKSSKVILLNNIDKIFINSIIKKKTGTFAGIPRSSNDYSSPTRNGNYGTYDDNDDFCASCGGNGEVVCCDGDTCRRSFHFKCVDPPIMPDALPDTWFCNECRVKQTGHHEEKTGPFRLLLEQLEGKNPGAFSLPLDIRNYFENVKTGPDGEYEEIMIPKPKVTNRSGWEETPDYFRKKDNKGKLILCHRCGLQAEAPDRLIIQCSFCSLYWHLDCLDMPLAKEPAPGRPWQCQAHIDDLLNLIPNSLGPAHRFRRIKGAPPIKQKLNRGNKNHGHIEIDNDLTDDEAESQSSFYGERPFGRIAKVSEQSIKLDFLLRVKKEGGGYTRARFSDARRERKRSWSQANLCDQQAALNLSALANSDPSLKGIENLITTLLIEAPPNVINMIAQGDAEEITSGHTQLSSSDKNSLLALRDLINKKLSCLEEDETDEPFRKKLR